MTKIVKEGGKTIIKTGEPNDDLTMLCFKVKQNKQENDEEGD